MQRIYLFLIIVASAIVFSCDKNEPPSGERFIGEWVMIKKENEQPLFKCPDNVVLKIKKDGQFYFANYIITRGKEVVDMHESISKQLGTNEPMLKDVIEQMFRYELSKDGMSLVNALDKNKEDKDRDKDKKGIRTLEFNEREGLIKSDEYGLWFERKKIGSL